MRYYDIQVMNPLQGANAAAPASPSSAATSGTPSLSAGGSSQGLHWRSPSFPTQTYVPGALIVAINRQTAFHDLLAKVNSSVRIYEVPLTDVSQAAKCHNCPISV